MRKFSSLVILFFSSYLLLFLFYNLVSQGYSEATFYLQMRRFIPCALTITFACGLWCGHFKSKPLVSHAIVALSWLITYPLLHYLSQHTYIASIDNVLDIAFGTYCFGLTVFFHFILRKLFPERKVLVSLVVTSLQFLLSIIPLVEWHFWFVFHNYVSPNVLYNLLTTGPTAECYLLYEPGSTFSFLASLLTAVIIYALLYYLNKPGTYTLPPLTITNNKKAISLACIFLLLILYYANMCIYDTGVINNYYQAQNFLIK